MEGLANPDEIETKLNSDYPELARKKRQLVVDELVRIQVLQQQHSWFLITHIETSQRQLLIINHLPALQSGFVICV